MNPRVQTHWPLQAVLRLQPQPRLSVLIFHRVMAQHDPLRPNEPTEHEFEHRMRWVRENFNVLPLDEAANALAQGKLPRRALAITFDDGYADNYTRAAPILKRLGLHATFYVATGFLDGGLMFNDAVIEALRQAPAGTLDLTELSLGRHTLGEVETRRELIAHVLNGVKYLPQEEREQRVQQIAQLAQAVLPKDLMMRSDEVTALHALGMAIGAHTQTHPILTRIPLDAARREIVRGSQQLEEMIGRRVTTFAYPNGRPQRDYGPEHVSLVRELGFKTAVSTARGAARKGADLFQIPRFTPWDHSDFRYGLRMAQTLISAPDALA